MTFVEWFKAVFKQFGGGGHGSGLSDNAELHQHQKLEKLYISTRAAKILFVAEGYIVTGSKQVEIGTKLSEDSRKYGSENTCTNGNVLTKAALSFGRARAQMEKERGNMLKALGTQVAEPLRAMVMGAPLEDARHLAQRYDRIRQEAEAQATEVARPKLQDLKSNMTTLGKEAASALSSVEDQQQKLTLERLISMVESERAYHQRVLQILDQLEGEMVSERQRIEAPTTPSSADNMPPPPSYEEANGVFASHMHDTSHMHETSHMHDTSTDSMGYFLGEVLFPYHGVTDVELSLTAGEYVVVRKVTGSGWAEGECKGKAGWFPYEYIERRERVLASKVSEVF
ncbi:hypothetical protein Bca52824_094659 [Brassica carinata]|uniref:SH3 domain-containing protein n=1 Tax=Brassica carinata TaxID=52824 RepID=A0A8X7P4Z9_BRACI|nr:hypothetical protein Bca52824_094659 [Brassica carinata]